MWLAMPSLDSAARVGTSTSFVPVQIQYSFHVFTAGIPRDKHGLNPLAKCFVFIGLHTGNLRLTFQTVQDPSSSDSHSGMSAHPFLSAA